MVGMGTATPPAGMLVVHLSDFIFSLIPTSRRPELWSSAAVLKLAIPAALALKHPEY